MSVDFTQKMAGQHKGERMAAVDLPFGCHVLSPAGQLAGFFLVSPAATKPSGGMYAVGKTGLTDRSVRQPGIQSINDIEARRPHDR
jgi:hypothetical protein